MSGDHQLECISSVLVRIAHQHTHAPFEWLFMKAEWNHFFDISFYISKWSFLHEANNIFLRKIYLVQPTDRPNKKLCRIYKMTFIHI